MSFYWITRLDAIVLTAGVIGSVLLTFALVMFLIGNTVEEWDKENEKDRKHIRATWITTFVGMFLVLVAIFTPTTEQACAIYFVDYLQKNEDARELPDKVIKSANLYFDKLIEELDKEQKEGKR